MMLSLMYQQQQHELTVTNSKFDIAGYRHLAECYFNFGKIDEALNIHQDNIKRASDLNLVVEVQRSYVNIGNCFRELASQGILILEAIAHACANMMTPNTRPG